MKVFPMKNNKMMSKDPIGSSMIGG